MLLRSFCLDALGRLSVASLGTLALLACARTSVQEGDLRNLRGQSPCVSDVDCDHSDLCAPQACVDSFCEEFPLVCESSDPCQIASCDSAIGCIEEPATTDLDGDGHKGALPGFVPGEPGSCGDDCDDTRSAALPGGREICDGVDNDCDGIVDNEASYLSTAQPEQGLVSLAGAELEASAARGIAFGDGAFALGYWGRADETLSYIQGLATDGFPVFSERVVSSVFAPSFGVDLAWSGSTFGAVWSDPRVDDNYEVYFSRFDIAGNKLTADLRLTEAQDFSIHSRILYDQGRFLVVFDDRRDEDASGFGEQEKAAVFAQIVNANGEISGQNLRLSESAESAEFPAIAASTTRLGLAYTVVAGTGVGLRFRTFDKFFENPSQPVTIALQGVRAPRVVALGESFLVTWDLYEDLPGSAIRGAVYDLFGQQLVPPRDLTAGATFARSHATLSLGDRVLLVWADDRDGNYEIYAKVLSEQLDDLEPRTRLTDDPADTIAPSLSLADDGHVGVVFDDWRSGAHGAYFMTLGCSDALTLE